MKKILVLFFASMAFAAKTVTPSVPALDTDGCYAISTAEELFGFADVVKASETHDECGKLTKDIAVNEYVNKGGIISLSGDSVLWTPIELFRGVFDGQDHAIEGLITLSSDSSDLGLFAELRGFMSDDGKKVAKPAVVKNLGLRNIYFEGLGNVGGIAGKASAAEVRNSYSDGSVIAQNVAGGLIGNAEFVEIGESYNRSLVQNLRKLPTEVVAGGLVGYTGGNLKIVNSYNMGSVGGDVFGVMVGASEGKLSIVNSFNSYKVTKAVAPLVGKYKEDETNVDNCFYPDDDFETPGALGTKMEQRSFQNGVVAQLLRDYNKDGVDGSVWGQRVYEYSMPQLIGKMLVRGVQDSIVAKKPALVEGCYQIGSAEELYGFAFIGSASRYADAPVCGKLTKDIVLNKKVLLDNKLNGMGENFIPWVPIEMFEGNFDGAGHSISGLYFNDEYSYDAGLFKSVKTTDRLREIKIENLGVEDTYVKAGNSGGSAALIGIVNIDSSGTVTIKNCHASLFSNSYASGGLVGYYITGKLVIEQSYATGRVFGDNSGGLLGVAYADVDIINSYAVTELQGGDNGTLIGEVDNQIKVRLVNSYGIDLLAAASSRDVYALIGHVYGKAEVEYVHVFSEQTDAAEGFADGTIAAKLHSYSENGISGEVWEQNVGVDKYPVLRKTIPDSTGMTTIATALKTSSVVVRSTNRMIEISGMQAGESYALLDMQGRLLQRGYASGSSVSLNVVRSGRYLVRVAGQVKVVTVR